MAKTILRRLRIGQFRALRGVEIEFGERITVVCGRNGTSKSSILGIAAQIFSFEKNYVDGTKLAYQQISGGSFKSKYSDHFRISERFDLAGSMSVDIELYDGYTGQEATAELKLMKRGPLPRPVVRKNSTSSNSTNRSRNFTHPVIFLSLKRLLPIADRDYLVSSNDYFISNKQAFISLNNELLNRSSSNATGTHGTIESAVAHGDSYDHESVSAGEDNAGQIILALMSFRKLKQEYPDYKGGLLLIDEADAGLFPTAQVNLLRMLDRECRDLDIQVIMTSHSPVIIEQAYERSRMSSGRCKTVYLSDTYGSVQVMHDWSWPQINADINAQTLHEVDGTPFPQVNVYFEDEEAAHFFKALISGQLPMKKVIRLLSDISLGCDQYLLFIRKRIPEFCEKSIICLDGDKKLEVMRDSYKTIVPLPGEMPPDQLLFEFLYNLPANDPRWQNELQFTRSVFTNHASDVISTFEITGPTLSLTEKFAAKNVKNKREVFKRFYKTSEIQRVVSSGTRKYNPWNWWVSDNPNLANAFLEQFRDAVHHVLKNGHYVDAAKLEALPVRLRKI